MVDQARAWRLSWSDPHVAAGEIFNAFEAAA